MYTEAMHEPTNEEMAAFIHVREYLRWQRANPFDLVRDDDDLLKTDGETVDFGGRLSLWEVYTSGYFNAARDLTLVPIDSFFLVFSVYPIIFLYRHYLELQIKTLILAACDKFQCAQPNIKNDHGIGSLWKKFKAITPSEHTAMKNNKNVERVLHQVEMLDPSSMDARYAYGKDFKTQSLPATKRLDLNNIREVMDRLSFELSAIRAELDFEME
jgi:hypothetical protein